MNKEFGALPPEKEVSHRGKLLRCDEQVIAAALPLSLEFLFGIPLLTWGLLQGIGGFILQVREGEYPGAFLLLGFGALIAIPGYLLLGPETLHIDVPTRTYKHSRYWWPFRQEQTGIGSDFDRLSLRTFGREGKKATLYIYWRDPKRQPFAFHSGDREEVLRHALAISALLHILLFDAERQLIEPDDASLPPSAEPYFTGTGNSHSDFSR
jgi:hypothetical protein